MLGVRHQLREAAAVFDIGLIAVAFGAGPRLVMRREVHVRFDGKAAVVSVLEKVRYDPGNIRIALAGKSVLEVGKQTVGVGNMATFLDVDVGDEGPDLGVEIPGLLLAIRRKAGESTAAISLSVWAGDCPP